MSFWVQSDTYEAVLTPLEHASVWIWLETDDHSGVKHSVRFPPVDQRSDRFRGEGRWAVIARWMVRSRTHSMQYPFRNLSED